MWKLTAFGKTRRGLPGVPWRDLTDKEYADAKKRHPGMEDQGYFIKVEKEEEPAPRRGRSTPEPEATGSPVEEVSDD